MGGSLATKPSNALLNRLVWPMFFENFLRVLLGSVSVFILGRYSDDAVAAVGVANQIINLVLMVYTVATGGAIVMISQNLGAGNHEEADRMSTAALVVNGGMGVALSLLMIVLARPALILMNLPAELLDDGVTYIRIVGGASFLQAGIATLSGIVRSYGNATPAMVVGLITNVLNALGSYLVVFRPFEVPLYGVTGVAIALVVSEILALLVMIYIVFGRMKIGIRLRYLSPFPRRACVQIMKIGFPAGVEAFSYNMAQIVVTSLITPLGAEVLSARVYLQNIVNFVYLLGMSVGQGVQITVGNCVGARDFDGARAVNRLGMKLALASNVVLSLVMILFRRQLLGIFTADEAIIAIAAPIFIADIAVEIFRAGNHIMVNSLRGSGDVRFPMYVALFSMWIVNLGVGYLFAFGLKLGLLGFWIGFASDEGFRAVTSSLRWRSGRWESKRVV